MYLFILILTSILLNGIVSCYTWNIPPDSLLYQGCMYIHVCIYTYKYIHAYSCIYRYTPIRYKYIYLKCIHIRLCTITIAFYCMTVIILLPRIVHGFYSSSATCNWWAPSLLLIHMYTHIIFHITLSNFILFKLLQSSRSSMWFSHLLSCWRGIGAYWQHIH